MARERGGSSTLRRPIDTDSSPIGLSNQVNNTYTK
jgi:hypothetical protein